MPTSNHKQSPNERSGEDFEIKLGFIIIRIKRITVEAIIALVIVLVFFTVLLKL